MPPARVALVGNLANLAYQTCKFLRRKRVEADVFIYQTELSDATSNPDSHDPGILQHPPDWLKTVPRAPQTLPLRKVWGAAFNNLSDFSLLHTLRKYDLIVSYCCAPWFVQEIGRPYISWATGSDLRELAMTGSPQGRHARSIFQHAQMVFHGPDPASLEAANALKLKSSFVFYPVDTEFYVPNDTLRDRTPADELLVFHPSNLDWTYQKEDRWTKGNDKLFRAFARLVRDGHNARLVYLERGPDIEATRELVKDLEIEQSVEAISGSVSRVKLRDLYYMADVVADQFSHTSFGQIGLEAMSCGRPVLVELDIKTISLYYDELPPVLNCGTEDGIYAHLKAALDREYRRGLGGQARIWIMKYHGIEGATVELIKRFETVLGRRIV